ncbi:hypothetical protein IU510_30350 [Nocardia cyriacigeorgica]|uniref:hypothetical protein n=1 Tax=Nocardia cyriacigeorgica TaxID=135487 RepID=UPI0018949DC4|nr:hypothetical protein [Nocardia cyriacigeorgica]MBF6102323.1 hypothetical protein [Nocardia cyriacigeorgica]MBF6162170.1 hypothetical protein [Nocardia cyriacigeorgica]MBF6200768.1 hypothetical protein [Nocardia cyriacigeorgica]MBF6518029.1 hypothetical protein [Nocardia cyriacigeorgica]
MSDRQQRRTPGERRNPAGVCVQDTNHWPDRWPDALPDAVGDVAGIELIIAELGGHFVDPGDAVRHRRNLERLRGEGNG